MNSIDKNWVDNHIGNNGEVIIPDGVEKIEADAFKDNEQISKVIMPDSVIEIGDRAFNNCSNLQDVEFSNNLKIIGEETFSNCKKLTNIELPKSIEDIKEEAFTFCENLEKFLIDEQAKISEIKAAVFGQCKNLNTVVLPKTIKSIREFSFTECEKLSEDIFTYLPELKIIEDGAFEECQSLKNINIPKSVDSIGEYVFLNCLNLQSVNFPDKSELKKIEKRVFENCEMLEEIQLPEGIEEIGMSAFNNCKSLKSVSLPESLKKINAAAFIDCSSLTDIKGGANIEVLKSGAFQNIGAKSFKVPKGVKFVENILENCSNLEELYLGEETEQILSNAVEGCTNLKKLVINEKLKYLPEMTLKDCKQLEEVEINGNQRIHYGSFQGRDSIRKITIDGKAFQLDENEQLFSLQRYNQNVAIVVKDNDGLLKTRCINMENGTENKENTSMYLANDGSVVRSINSIADISLDNLKMLQEQGEKKLHLYGATRDLKPSEIEKGIEYDLYNIDDLIQIKEQIQDMKKEISIPPKEDKHRQKKIYAQMVRNLSERMEYDFYESYQSAKNEQEREKQKATYKDLTGKNLEEYLEENKGVDIEKSKLEDGNLLGFLNGKSVCRGNVEIIRNLAAEFGIETNEIIGIGHTWNQVKLDGVWYDDDFTNYQNFLKQGDLEKTSRNAFLRGQIKGESVLSRDKLYSKTVNQPNDIGNDYTANSRKLLLNYGRNKQQNIQPSIQEQQKEQTKTETIKDEVGNELKPKTQEQQQNEQEAEAKWMNSFQACDQAVAKMQDGAKKKKEVVQLIQNLEQERKQEQNIHTQEENENQEQGR